ncbi:MAG: TetR/AcrR family transcriptional regulator, partial [Acidimicrobiaceae bacterium]|nr:TetR/AcrR family transcriptional regulator [Acidimicrobiaceae bacterium]
MPFVISDPLAPPAKSERPTRQRGAMRTSSGARPSAELRRRLLEAMGEVVGERGYAKTSVADVIRTAGAARSSFYKLFEDKQNAYLAAFDMVVERVEDEMRTAAGRTPGDGELTPEQWSADLRA